MYKYPYPKKKNYSTYHTEHKYPACIIRLPASVSKEIDLMHSRHPENCASYIINGLIILAINYLYEENGSYIPCKLSRRNDTFLTDPDKSVRYTIRLNTTTEANVRRIQQVNHYKTYSGTISQLVKLALSHCTTNYCYFSHPIPLDPDHSSHNITMPKNPILLDIF